MPHPNINTTDILVGDPVLISAFLHDVFTEFVTVKVVDAASNTPFWSIRTDTLATKGPLKAGQVVHIKTNIEAPFRHGFTAYVHSKTDYYQVDVHAAHVTLNLDPNLPPEPAEPDTLLWSEQPGEDVNVFHRNPNACSTDRRRRYDEHWFSIRDGEFMDWPRAHALGADPNRRLTLADALQ